MVVLRSKAGFSPDLESTRMCRIVASAGVGPPPLPLNGSYQIHDPQWRLAAPFSQTGSVHASGMGTIYRPTAAPVKWLLSDT